MKAKQHRLAT